MLKLILDQYWEIECYFKEMYYNAAGDVIQKSGRVRRLGPFWKLHPPTFRVRIAGLTQRELEKLPLTIRRANGYSRSGIIPRSGASTMAFE